LRNYALEHLCHLRYIPTEIAELLRLSPVVSSVISEKTEMAELLRLSPAVSSVISERTENGRVVTIEPAGFFGNF